jgi:hypothetical protein
MLAGCGYRLGARGGLLSGVRTVHVPPFASGVREPGAGVLFARALREELMARAGLRLASATAADAVVAGNLKAYDRGGFAFPTLSSAGGVRVGEFRATVRAEVSVRRRADGKVLFSTGDVVVSGEYLLGPDVIGSEANRERALRQLAADLARRVADLIADAF